MPPSSTFLAVMVVSLTGLIDVALPAERGLDVAPGPFGGGVGTIGVLFFVLAVVAGGFLYFRNRRKP